MPPDKHHSSDVLYQRTAYRHKLKILQQRDFFKYKQNIIIKSINYKHVKSVGILLANLAVYAVLKINHISIASIIECKEKFSN